MGTHGDLMQPRWAEWGSGKTHIHSWICTQQIGSKVNVQTQDAKIHGHVIWG